MKPLFFSFFCLFFITTVYSQDTITKKSGEIIAVKLLEVNPADVKFKMFDNQDGPVFTVLKSEIQTIKYENGTKSVVTETLPVELQEDLFRKGNFDANKYYDNYHGAGTVTLVTSLLMPLAGLVPAIACSSTPPKEENLNYPSHNLMQKPDYANSYKRRSKKIKQGKVWMNWGIGFGFNLALVMILYTSGANN
jgi:hypothetical protein